MKENAMPENTIPVLEKSGDPLEREICKDVADLRIVLQPYSEIWFNHIMIRRKGDNSRVDDEWMNFAGSNYSALLRVHHALVSFRRLNELAITDIRAEESGRFLLEVHREWASFWENMGSAIDNLAMAFQDCIPAIIKEKARDYLRGKYKDIEYAYNRRTQFIHSRIVPALVRDGVVQFRIRFTEIEHRHLEPKESRWDLPYDKELVLGDVLSKEWEIFLKAMSDVWNWLLSELRTRDAGRLAVFEVKFPGMTSTQIQNSIVSSQGGYTPISSVEFDPGIQTKSTTVAMPPFVNQPPPSGNIEH